MVEGNSFPIDWLLFFCLNFNVIPLPSVVLSNVIIVTLRCDGLCYVVSGWVGGWDYITEIMPKHINNNFVFNVYFSAVRADRMRGGRNKFGPMYKRDRARKLQVMRERQLTTPGSGRAGGSGVNSSPNNSNSGAGGSGMTGGGHSSAGLYPDMGYSPSGNVYGTGVKHEIQIPQVSSLTSSPDSSPSPLTAASLGYPGQFFFLFLSSQFFNFN